MSEESNIFICYRREDARAYARLLYDKLADEFGPDRVFKDIDKSRPGHSYVEEIQQWIDKSGAMLVVIGKGWLNAEVDGTPRLEQPNDPVRREIGAALRREGRIMVIPVLVGDAPMPSKAALPAEVQRLADIDAVILSERHWRIDLQELIDVVRQAVDVDEVANAVPRSLSSSRSLSQLSKLPPPAWKKANPRAEVSEAPKEKEDLSKLPPPKVPRPSPGARPRAEVSEAPKEKEDLSKLPPPKVPRPSPGVSPPGQPPDQKIPRIFICYRRDDTPLEAELLKTHLVAHLKAEFILDIDAIPFGTNFVKYIRQQVGSCEAMIIIIGHQWMTIEKPGGEPSIQDPRDWVHIEIKTALERGIPTFPVLIDGAPPPKPDELPESIAEIGELNAAALHRDSWAADCLYMATKVGEALKGSGDKS